MSNSEERDWSILVAVFFITSELVFTGLSLPGHIIFCLILGLKLDLQNGEYEVIFQFFSQTGRGHTPALTKMKKPGNIVIFEFCFSIIELTNRPVSYRYIIFNVSSIQFLK